MTEGNTVKPTVNVSTNMGEVIMPGIRKASGKDFGTKSNKNLASISCVLGSGKKSLRIWKRV